MSTKTTESERQGWRALRKLDAEVAERVMEWRNVSNAYLFSKDDGWGGDNPQTPDEGIQDIPHYSTDTAAAMRVEDRIAELGLQSPYYGALVRIAATAITDRVFDLFDVVHATPEQRCRAALAALAEKES